MGTHRKFAAWMIVIAISAFGAIALVALWTAPGPDPTRPGVGLAAE